MIILRCTNEDNVVQDIQVQEQVDLKLDISAIENATIGDVYGISSQEFSLPGNNETNQFFGNLYNLGVEGSVALQNSIECQVLLKGAEVFKGKLYIKNIVTDPEGYNTLYNVIVVNETVDFKFEIQNVYLNQLDFSAYDHNFTYANISQSWGGGLKGGAIVYPFVNYGKPEGDPTAPDFAFAAFNSTGSNTIDNYESPLRLIDFKPAIRAKDVVDVIFSGSSYEYTSSFFNTEYFEDLYVLTTANDNLGPNNTSPISQSAWAYNESGSQTIPAGNIAKVEFDNEVVDNSNNFSLVNDRYTADTEGTYQYQINVNYLTLAWAPSNQNTVTILLRKNGGNIVDSQFYYNIPATGSAILDGAIALLAGDYLEVEIAPVGKSITIRNEIGKPSYLPNGYQTYFQVKGPPSELGANVDMGEQFPDNLKALDFLQGLIEKFNLVVEPVPNSRNLIRIEPYQDWIDSGVSKDFTDKVDRSERFEISHPIVEQPRTIIFSDEEDNDVLNQYSIKNKGSIYGSYTFTSDSDLAEGERRVGKVFAATPVTGVPNGRTFVVPHLCTVTDNREFKPIQFKPRLLYNNGLQDVPDTALGIQTGSIDRGTIFIRDENAVTQPVRIWNQMSTLTSIPVDFNNGQDLHFNNDLYTPFFQVTANGKVKADAFRTYWATYINGLYDYDARKLTCNIYLKPTEIQNIALNDKLFIDGAYYRINRINGANLTRRDTVEVELIKILTAQFKFPKRRIFTAPGTYVNVVNDYSQLSINGTGRYINVDTGDTVNDFSQLRQVAAKDNFQIYNFGGTGSLVWDYQQPVDTTNQFDQTSLGTNQIAVGASKVNALGNNNSVKEGSETSLVVGANNLIAENTSNVAAFGQSHIVESAVSNAQIIGGVSNTISGSNNSVIVGGTGSLFVNNDSAVLINGENDAIRDSDFTTAINSHANEVIINGSGHTVIGLNREGNGLDLLNTRNNSNFLGDTYIGGGYLVDSFTKNVGDGTNIFLTGSSYGNGKHETLYILNWNGLSPGTASINLPSAANSDYKGVVYTFKLASSNSGEVVRIIPFDPAQTIDGATSYSTSGSYAFVSIHASGSKWHVIDSSTGTGGGSAPITSGSFTGSFSGSFTGSISGSITSASYALTASCADNIKVTNIDQPDPLVYYYTQVESTGSGCKALETLDTIGLRYNGSTNTHLLNSDFTVTGSVRMTGSLSVTGSLRGNVVTMSITNSTTSMDLSRGNAFYLFLNTGSALVTSSNIVPNQHISLFVSQSGSGNLYFDNTFYFSGSSFAYTASQTAGARDILTFETYNINPPGILNTGINYALLPQSGSPLPVVSFMSASGGTMFTSGSFRIHVLTGSGTFTVHRTGSAPNNVAEILVVAGGGGGFSAGGGGGAGGLIYSSSYQFVATSYPTSSTITIGAGGAAATQGNNTIFFNQTAIGGGSGGADNVGTPPSSGGSGGGTGANSVGQATGSGTAGQGNRGSVATFSGAPAFAAGGGGGAGQVGQNFFITASATGSGPGGSGSQYIQFGDITGTGSPLYGSPTGWFAGGGGGRRSDAINTWAAYGGIGGGGNGNISNGAGGSGVANTGGGGGGGAAGGAAGTGGSGIVIIKYRFQT